jgi:CRISPR-associated protein Csm2
MSRVASFKDAFEKAGYKGGEQHRTPPQVSQPKKQANQDIVTLEKGYTAKAEAVIQELQRSMGRNYQDFTTSKIRNILAMVSDIYNDLYGDQEVHLSQEMQNRIEYLKVRLVYECGREPRVIKPFVEKAQLLPLLESIGDSSERFRSFARYMEALVAYHRFYGGKDS